MKQVLPIIICGILSDEVCEPIIELCHILSSICLKELKKDELELLVPQIAITVCKLERLFPPSFFDVMVYLLLHLPEEALIGGNIHYRWMYPFERLEI